VKKTIKWLQEYSIPLIAGVITALLWANLEPHSYHDLIHYEVFRGVTVHFLVQDVFMVFFFAIAAVEITQSLRPGGALNPVKKALNPLMATAGGVIGPALVYTLLNLVIGTPELAKGWGIPTATDIALAWLVARTVFGANHAAVKFLLLLAIADDAIGLFIIAAFYPDPFNPVAPMWLLLVLAGMAAAYLLRKAKVRSYWPYLLAGGLLSWFGLYKAHMHPALALVFIIPFLPGPTEEEEHSPLINFEHQWKVFIDLGLFFFGLANAGVAFSQIGPATWLVFSGLLLGKSMGIFGLGLLGDNIGFPLPNTVGKKELLVAGIVAGLGLTVALFVAGAAFTDPVIQGAAKMGALFSAFIAVLAIVAGQVLGIKKIQ